MAAGGYLFGAVGAIVGYVLAMVVFAFLPAPGACAVPKRPPEDDDPGRAAEAEREIASDEAPRDRSPQLR